MKLKTFLVTIKDGKPLFGTKRSEYFYHEFFKQFEGQVCSLTLEPKKSARTLSQNSYYWLYLGMIAESAGNTPEDIHEWAKGKFLSSGIATVFGDKVRKKGSTAKLSKLEFGEFIDKIAMTTQIPPPDPTPFNFPLTHEEYDKIKEKQSEAYAEKTIR